MDNRYLIEIQYLGFRYHGWMKQPGVKTVESMVEKTLGFVFGHGDFKILGAGRTDAMVSAQHFAFALFTPSALPPDFLSRFNANLPPDIRALAVRPVDESFNILQSPRVKEYRYFFATDPKPHPFCAPLLAHFPGRLDINAMAEGARCFEGRHNFVKYCTKPGENTQLVREILHCRILENTELTASFFPDQTWMLSIRSKGFLRYQIRLIMGQLAALGRGEISLDTLCASLSGQDPTPLKTIAPASGLMVHGISFNGEPFV